jgi:hypothetical protein
MRFAGYDGLILNHVCGVRGHVPACGLLADAHAAMAVPMRTLWNRPAREAVNKPHFSFQRSVVVAGSNEMWRKILVEQ